ncbi:MAG: hypothetical protein FJY37_09615 [Betaproteobacteria bacterium]|nr:hypothetical protein [Betaproteobacteria bacterium]
MLIDTGQLAKKWRRWLSARQLLAIIWPFLITVPLLVLLTVTSMSILSAGRSYIEGESLWSKAFNQSVYYLLRYTQTLDERDYERSLLSLEVPDGVRIAREEMDRRDPDLAVVRAGVLQGQIHPSDVDGAIIFYRYFRDVPMVRTAIEHWTTADKLVAELRKIAESTHQLVQSSQINSPRGADLIGEIHDLREAMRPLNEEFSRSLSDAMRWAQRVLLLVTFGIAVILVLASVTLSRRMLRRREEMEAALRKSEERFQLAVAGANDGVWDWDLETNRMYYPRD